MIESIEPAQAKRPYDARRRRERAEEQRRATRSRVIDAAGRLFTDKGYVATTMTDIAREAGVAMQSVYSAGKSKGDLLVLAVERAVAGDDQDLYVHERPSWTAVREEPDPQRQMELIAAALCEVQERSAAMQTAFRQAAGVDPAVAEILNEAQSRRRQSIGALIRMVPEKHLRLSYTESTDTTWALAAPEVWLLLRQTRGWSAKRIRAWLARTLADALLARPITTGRS
jgi:AcrR family transcriptional regulator